MKRYILLLILLTSSSFAGVNLAWNPSPDKTVVGYKIYYGTNPDLFQYSIKVGNINKYTVNNLKHQKTYYFIVTGYNRKGVESLPTNEVSYYQK